MTDRRIQTFLALYDAMSYHEAARLLNLTQPAVTQQIQSLEREYGRKLFSYDHRALTRLPAADTLALYARSEARRERLLRQELTRAEQQAPLRIGATKTIGDYVLPDAAARYLAVPEHRLTVLVDNTKNLLGSLERDEIDFALVEGDFDRRRYDSRLVRMEPFVGICARTHPFAERVVPVAELLRQTLILREPGSGTRAIAERLLAGHGYTPGQFQRAVCMSSFGLICRLVQAGAGVSFVYRAVADAWEGLSVFQLEGSPVEHAFHCVYLREGGAEPLVEAFGPL